VVTERKPQQQWLKKHLPRNHLKKPTAKMYCMQEHLPRDATARMSWKQEHLPPNHLKKATARMFLRKNSCHVKQQHECNGSKNTCHVTT
jgi:hypothetical protein